MVTAEIVGFQDAEAGGAEQSIVSAHGATVLEDSEDGVAEGGNEGWRAVHRIQGERLAHLDVRDKLLHNLGC